MPYASLDKRSRAGFLLAIITWGVLVAFLLFLSTPARADQAQYPERVLLITSYHQGDRWNDNIVLGVRDVLGRLRHVNFAIENMDMRRNIGPENERLMADYLRAKYRDKPQDLILVSDDPALDFLFKIRSGLFPRTPVVFCGVNNLTPDRLQGQSNITGVNEEASIARTLEQALALFPKTTRIAGIVSDREANSRTHLAHFRAVAKRFKGRVEFVELLNLTTLNAPETLRHLPGNSLVLRLINILKPENGYMSLQESMNLISEHSPVPVFTAWDFDVGEGALGGNVISGFEQGHKAAELAVKILGGLPPDQIPVVMASPNIPMFDHRQMQRFGLSAEDLPPGAVILNRPFSFYEHYKKEIWFCAAVMTLLCALVVTLWVAIYRRKAAERRLADSERQYRLIVDTAAEGIFYLNAECVITYANATFHSMLGFTQDELVGMNLSELIAPEEMEDHNATMARRRSGESATYERRMHRKDGSRVWTSVAAQALMSDQGAFMGGFGMVSDITERKRAEQALLESRNLYRTLVENLPLSIMTFDQTGRIDFVNQCHLDTFARGKRDKEFFIGRKLDELPGVVSAGFGPKLRPLLEGQPVNLDGEFIPQLAGGGSGWQSIRGIPLYNDGLLAGGILMREDITERKRAEQALVASEEKFRTVADHTYDWEYWLGPDGRLVWISPSCELVTGYTVEEFMSDPELLRRIVHPEDVPTHDEHQHEIEMGSIESCDMDFRILHSSGRTVWINHSCVDIARDDGTPLGRRTSNRDITERKSLELRLANHLAFQEALLDTIPYPVFYKGIDTCFVGFNKAYEEIFGVRRDDLIGKRVLDLEYLPVEDRLAYQAEDEATIASVGRVSKEMPIPFADGEMHQTLYSVSGFRLADGSSGGLIGLIVDITERKRTEEALKKSELFLESLIENLPLMLFVKDAEELRFVRFNRAGEMLLGYSRNELLGKNDYDFFSAAQADFFTSKDRDVLRSKVVLDIPEEQISTRFQGERILHTMKVPILKEDGTPVFLLGISEDITVRKQTEESLRQSEEKFSRIFEMTPESISFVRLKDSVRIAANAAFETITGYPREEAIGRSVKELCHWDEPAMRDEFLKRLLADGRVKDFEFLLRRKDGSLRRVLNSAQLVSIAGEQCYVSVIHDITEERKMQEVLIQSEKMMSLGSLAAGIAHEINNPLGIVHQAVQHLLMRIDPTHEKNKKMAADLGLDMNLLQQYLQARKVGLYLEDIQAAAQRASGIIRNMLNFSRRSESKRQICDLPQILEQSIFLASSDYDLKKSFDFKNIEIVLDVDDNLPRCSCTETEIEQVILNLLRNAAQAMAMATPPTVNPRIDIRLRVVDAGVRIEVADNGPGMDEKIQRKVLEPFFTTKPPGIGTGLGLSVSYFIITKGHGGRMWLSSAPGKGATFFIELPAETREVGHA